MAIHLWRTVSLRGRKGNAWLNGVIPRWAIIGITISIKHGWYTRLSLWMDRNRHHGLLVRIFKVGSAKRC